MMTVLFDNHEDYSFLADHFDGAVYSPASRYKMISWIRGAMTALRCTRNEDVIVCWFDFQAVLLFYLCKLSFRRRKILCLNILLKPKDTFKNRVATLLYRIALASPSFVATVTSREYGDLLNRKLGRNFKYHLLHDVYHESYDIHHTGHVRPNTVFCGGRNGRDWAFMMDVAAMIPEVDFNMIVPRNVYDRYSTHCGSNIRLETDLNYDEFLLHLSESQIVALPLDTEAPAGLIVMFQAAANMRPVITTKTVTTSEYVTADRGVSLPNDTEMWANAIREALENPAPYMKKAEAMKDFLRTDCSESIFLDKLDQIITTL